MRLILFGLVSLIGNALSQEYQTVFNDLPFGARLPGNEKPIAAYSYTVKDGSTRQKTNHDKILQPVVKINNNEQYSSNWDKGRIRWDNIFKDSDSVEYDDHTYTNLQIKKGNRSPYKTPFQHLIPPINKHKLRSTSREDRLKENVAELSDKYSLALGSIHSSSSEEVADPLSLSHLQPNKFIVEKVNSKRQLYFKPVLPIVEIPEKTYFPPQKSEVKDVKLENSYLPPKESKVIVPESSYLPPKVIVPENSYLPPKVIVPENSYLPPKVIVPESSYLPPKVIVPENSYLPPKKTIDDIVPVGPHLTPKIYFTIKEPDLSHLAPKQTINEKVAIPIDTPSKTKDNINIFDNSHIVPEVQILIKKPDNSYLPPPNESIDQPFLQPYLPPLKRKESPLLKAGGIGKSNLDYSLFLEKPIPPALSTRISNEVNRLEPIIPTSKSVPHAIRTRIVNNPITPIKVKTSYQRLHTYQVPVKYPSGRHRLCTDNSECYFNEVCQDGCCIDGCETIRNICIGNAKCQTRRHISSCVCPPSFVAQTIRGHNREQYDCVAMPMTSTPVRRHAQRKVYRPISQSIRPIESPIRISRPVSRPQQFFTGGSGDPCRPSPCGDNTRCDVSPRTGVAQCRCIDGYIPDDHTIKGCKPQCSRDNDCPDDYRCNQNRCERVCQRGACGLHANCDSVNHRRQCRCPAGYVGNPDVSCRFEVPEVRVQQEYNIDLCDPTPCGFEANCRVRGDRPVCSCPIGYEGDALTRCIKGECIEHRDCRSNQACKSLRCIDPCGLNVCGSGSECSTKNHQPVCSCPRGHTGDPFTSCRRITEYDLCNPSPCGDDTNCRARSDRNTGELRAVCSCVDTYIGDPLTRCRPECERDTDCNSNQGCKNNRCRNPCVDACGTDAYCDVVNHRAECRCHEFAIGDPRSRCSFECTRHTDCNQNQACSQQYRCMDPCDGACGTDAKCEVKDHTPICSCPKTRTGDPFRSCRLFTLDDLCADNPCGTNAECTPGKDNTGADRPVCTCLNGYIGNPIIACERGDCLEHRQCPDSQACYQFQCTSPCYYRDGNFEAKSVCGENADCRVEDHNPVCVCARGWTGNPLDRCVIATNARVAGSTSRRVSGSPRFVSAGHGIYV